MCHLLRKSILPRLERLHPLCHSQYCSPFFYWVMTFQCHIKCVCVAQLLSVFFPQAYPWQSRDLFCFVSHCCVPSTDNTCYRASVYCLSDELVSFLKKRSSPIQNGEWMSTRVSFQGAKETAITGSLSVGSVTPPLSTSFSGWAIIGN